MCISEQRRCNKKQIIKGNSVSDTFSHAPGETRVSSLNIKSSMKENIL